MFIKLSEKVYLEIKSKRLFNNRNKNIFYFEKWLELVTCMEMLDLTDITDIII